MSVLIIGLGNPGSKYENNRHNIGFKIVDLLIQKNQAKDISNKKFKGELCRSGEMFFLKPTTFMNLSGESVLIVKEYYNIEKIIVVHDDLELDFGVVRFKKGGGHGGHNGLRSLDEYIGKEYLRVRVGIGKPEIKAQISSHVLSDFSQEENELLDDLKSHLVKATTELITEDLKIIQQKYTTKKIQ